MAKTDFFEILPYICVEQESPSAWLRDPEGNTPAPLDEPITHTSNAVHATPSRPTDMWMYLDVLRTLNNRRLGQTGS